MEYLKIENGKITGHYSAKKMPEGKEFKEVTEFDGIVGDPIEWYKETGERFSDEEMVSKGFIEDNRGTVYDKDRKKPPYKIIKIGELIPKGYTSLEPGQFDKWNGSSWEEDSILKKEYEDSQAIYEAQNYLYSTDYMVIKAMESGVSLEELYPGKSAKRESCRVTIRTLELKE